MIKNILIQIASLVFLTFALAQYCWMFLCGNMVLQEHIEKIIVIFVIMAFVIAWICFDVYDREQDKRIKALQKSAYWCMHHDDKVFTSLGVFTVVSSGDTPDGGFLWYVIDPFGKWTPHNTKEDAHYCIRRHVEAVFSGITVNIFL